MFLVKLNYGGHRIDHTSLSFKYSFSKINICSEFSFDFKPASGDYVNFKMFSENSFVYTFT